MKMSLHALHFFIMQKYRLVLGLGDLVVIGVVTIIGFATHGETGLSFLPRMLATFLPLTFAWFLLAPWLGLFKPEVISDLKQTWRPALAMILAAPLAGVLRAVLLNDVVIPIFVLILGTTTALGLSIWRALFSILSRRNLPRA